MLHLPASVAPEAPTPTWEDVCRMWEEYRPPYVLAVPPDRREEALDAVRGAGLAHMVEAPTLFRRDMKPISPQPDPAGA